MNPHNWMSALDPAGTKNRRWQCQYCKDVGRLAELESRECSYVYPPCRWCGETPTCAKDCKGIAQALSGALIIGEGHGEN